MTTVLCHDIPMDHLHVVLELLCRHCRSKLITTYQCSLTLPECVSLSRLPLFVRHLTFLPPDEYGGTYHCLCLIQGFLQANPVKHAYKNLQFLLHPHGFSTHNMAVVCVDCNVMFCRFPTYPVICLMLDAYLYHYRPYQCIGHNVKYSSRYWVPLDPSSTHIERPYLVPSWLWYHNLVWPKLL